MPDRNLFDIWEETGANPWKAQLVNYVGSFPTQGAAERYCEAVRRHRASEAPKAAVPKKK